ncbi:MAG: hypothetical protein LAC69_00260 [Chlorobium sp.]|jgi:hypothetical protein|nr:hypothetical protein [Chlorobium sp.]
MKRDRPNKMRIWSGGCFGNNYELTFDGSNLIYSARVDGDTTEDLISATREDWEAFRSEIDAIGIWNWHAHYYNSDILDGNQWEVKIKWGGRSCRIDGSNDYPTEDGTPLQTDEPADTFSRFLHAVMRLAGGRAFE